MTATLYPANDFSSNTNNLKTYYECSRAVDYYIKAMHASAEREVNAEALFMMYACDYSFIITWAKAIAGMLLLT
jgi:hypothetical protein